MERQSLRCCQGAFDLLRRFAALLCCPPPDDSQHVSKRLERCVHDVFLFAEPAKGSFGEDMIDASGNASVGVTVADQHGGLPSAGIDRARDGALADAALYEAGG